MNKWSLKGLFLIVAVLFLGACSWVFFDHGLTLENITTPNDDVEILYSDFQYDYTIRVPDHYTTVTFANGYDWNGQPLENELVILLYKSDYNDGYLWGTGTFPLESLPKEYTVSIEDTESYSDYTGDYYDSMDSTNYQSETTYVFSFVGLADTDPVNPPVSGEDSYETDNTFMTASSLPVNTVQNRTLHTQNDYDYINVTLVDFTDYELVFSNVNGFLPDVKIYDDSEQLILSSDQTKDDWTGRFTLLPENGLNMTILVKSVNESNPGSYTVSLTSTARTLPAPSGVSATDGTMADRVEVTWNNVPEAALYNVYRGLDSANMTLIGSVDGQAASLVYSDILSADNVFQSGLEYYYAVTTIHANQVEGDHSTADTGYPAPLTTPSDLAAGLVDGVIQLSWTATSDPLVEYVVLQSEDNGAFSPLSQDDAAVIMTSMNTAQVFLNGREPEVDYSFTVQPVATGIVGDSSNSANVRIPFTAYQPDAPQASENRYYQIRIQWNPVEGVSEYKLYRSASQPENGDYSSMVEIAVLDGTSTEYYDSSVDTATYYHYSIRMVRNGLESLYSISDSGQALQP